VANKQLEGREPEIVEIKRLLADAKAGNAGCRIIEGPRGIGKSELARWTVCEARKDDVFKVCHRVAPRIYTAPNGVALFKARKCLADAGADPIPHDLAKMLKINRRKRRADFLDAWEAVTRQRPFCWILDEAQNEAEETAEALCELMDGRSGSGEYWAVLLCMIDPEKPDGFAPLLERCNDVARIKLAGLSDDAVAQMLHARTGVGERLGLAGCNQMASYVAQKTSGVPRTLGNILEICVDTWNGDITTFTQAVDAAADKTQEHTWRSRYMDIDDPKVRDRSVEVARAVAALDRSAELGLLADVIEASPEAVRAAVTAFPEALALSDDRVLLSDRWAPYPEVVLGDAADAIRERIARVLLRPERDDRTRAITLLLLLPSPRPTDLRFVDLALHQARATTSGKALEYIEAARQERPSHEQSRPSGNERRGLTRISSSISEQSANATIGLLRRAAPPSA